jgi:L-2,4-diaminobutyric acid acetyltransferase
MINLIANDRRSIPHRESTLRGEAQHGALTWRPGTWQSANGREYVLRAPLLTDGTHLWTLAQDNAPLEVNSPYSYILLARFFTGTCVVAERNAEPVGFVSAFVCPSDAETLFVWQIAVKATERGQGLGRELLYHLLARPACEHIRFLEATAASSNAASHLLFRSLARDLGVRFAVHAGLAPELFPEGAHERENLICIGPLSHDARESEGGDQASLPTEIGESS